MMTIGSSWRALGLALCLIGAIFAPGGSARAQAPLNTSENENKSSPTPVQVVPTPAQSGSPGSLLPSISDQTKWSLRNFDILNNQAAQINSGQPDTFTARVARTDGTDWHVRIELRPGYYLKDGVTYTLMFQGRADALYPISVLAQRDDGRHENIGLNAHLVLGLYFQTYSITFSPRGATFHPILFSIPLSGTTGVVSIKDLRLTADTSPTLRQPASEPANWSHDEQSGAAVTARREGDALRIDVTRADGVDWHAQVYQSGIALRRATSYTLTFTGKADKPRMVPVSAMDPINYGPVGLNSGANLTTDWQFFTFTFLVPQDSTRPVRIPVFAVGAQTGAIWIKDLTLQQTRE